MTTLLQAKLITGEWVIGQVQETLEEKDTITLKQPLMIHVVQQQPGQYGIALIPYDPTNPEGTVEIFRSAIIARPASIAKGLHDSYIERTSTIEIVSNLEDVK